MDSEDDRGMTPLHHALEHPECIRLLLGEGAEVDASDHEGRTPLQHAIADGHLEAVEAC